MESPEILKSINAVGKVIRVPELEAKAMELSEVKMMPMGGPWN